MQPRSIVTTFLGLSLSLVALFGFLPAAPAATAEKGSKSEASACTLGSCPRLITGEDNGRILTYGIGTVITIADAIRNSHLRCEPEPAFERQRHAYADQPRESFLAGERGTCVLLGDEFRAELRVSRFR